MIEVEHPSPKSLITIRASGKLTADDYDAALPEIENSIQQCEGPVRFLVRLEGVDGMELGAVWRDVKFDMKHKDDMGKVAIVGDNKLERWLTKISAPFLSAKVRFFDSKNLKDAEAWIRA